MSNNTFRNYQYQDLIISYLKEPRDVHTIPQYGTPIWFFTYVEAGYVYVRPAYAKTPSSKIRNPRRLNPSEFDTMLELYHRRCAGENVSLDASKATQNQVYWYGIFHDIENMGCDTFQPRSITDTEVQAVGKAPHSPVDALYCNRTLENNHILDVCGYRFYFVQQLIPECKDGQVKEYTPQEEYVNFNRLPLGPNGNGTFCRFSICAPTVSGVYLWVANNEIIYIGETVNLAQRFNGGYGYISPRNCYAHGQSTNCKMNKVVMEYYKKGTIIDLYFLQTKNYKQIELSLLRQINTKYNVKDNQGR